MSGMIQSEKLKCDCGSEQFLHVVTLLHSPTGGTTPQPFGYQCQQCHALVDIGHLVGRLKVKHAKAQIAELEAQIGSAPAPKVTEVAGAKK